jgi:hypothetical protein
LSDHLEISQVDKALTTLDAIKLFGTPSRVRCDYDVENVDVCTYMEGIRGVNRGSAIKGKSCQAEGKTFLSTRDSQEEP